MISRRSGWAWICGLKRSATSCGKYSSRSLGEEWILGYVGLDETPVQLDLRVAQDDRELGAREAASGRATLLDLLVGRQELERAVEQAARLEHANQARVLAEPLRRARVHHRQRLRLRVVVAEHERRDLVRHLREQLVALRTRQLLLPDRLLEQDLDVDLAVGAVDAARVVDEVRVDLAAAQRVFDAAALREAEIAALGDDAAAQLAAVDAHRVVAGIPRVEIRLDARFHVGADAAVPEQVDTRTKNGADQLEGRHRRARQVEHALRVRVQLDRLRLPRVHAAALGQRGAFVVVPARARQLEQAPALGDASRGVRVRVDEDVAMVERGDELHVRRQQQPVAEHVAAHVADAHHREVFLRRVEAELAEVALHGLPCPARRDRDLLVVVARRPARRERVAEPERVLGGQGVRDVGEGRRALVGRDDEVGVVFVLAQHPRGRHDSALDDVVGHVEHPADERLIARDDLALDRVAIAGRQRFADEAALRAVRHDHGVLHLLRLHQAEHLGAEVLAPIRPANAAASDLRRPQVHGFHALRVDEDLEPRLRFRQVRQRVRIELERDVRLRRAVRAALVIVRAQQRTDDRAVCAEDPVVVEVLGAVELALERCFARNELARALVGGPVDVERRLELVDQSAAIRGIAREHGLHVGLAVPDPRLQHVLAERAQQRRLAPVEARARDEGVEAVVVRVAAQHRREALFEARAERLRVEGRLRGRLELEILDPERLPVGLKRIGAFAEHAHA